MMLPNLVALSFITLPVASLTLTTVTYNMLSTSLSSPSIPWLLKLPKTIDPTGAVLEQVEAEYICGWHKNTKTGNYKRFRKLFGAIDLTMVNWTRIGVQAETESSGRCYVDGELRKTLPEILNELCPKETQDQVADFVAALHASKQEVYSWSYGRGRRVLDACTNNRGLGGHHRWKKITSQKPSVVVLCEYDVHGDYPDSQVYPMFMKRQTSNYPPPLPYLSDVPPGGAPNLYEYDASYDVFMKKGMEGCDTFAEAMCRLGYHSILFNAPGADGAGLGMFLDSAIFDWKGGKECCGVKWDSVFIDEEYEDVFCVDLEEMYTRVEVRRSHDEIFIINNQL
ncbi:hypothetical protein TL16_g01921 [Triparma laevis f. inornata]|uniref:Uncharacterized protein n=1 Tax=Triparma laevis f. inornata TaxID=1714386 RepID=A0A9W6ZQX4_9STRA|nr:hypothetical protein TL16_g01921 [Triparma laevis f. inornata]